MTAICENRPDGSIGLYKGILTTCTSDIFLVPLPSLFIILMFAVCFAIRSRHPGQRDDADFLPLSDYTPKSSSINRQAINTYRTAREKRESNSGFRLLLACVCAGLLLAAMGLEVYEMVRLSHSSLGIGLLPLLPPGILLCIIPLFLPTHGTNKHPRSARPHFFPWALACMAFGVLSVVLLAVRLDSLIKLGDKLGTGVDKNPTKVKGFYTNSTRKFHNIVLCALYGGYTIVYTVLWYTDSRTG